MSDCEKLATCPFFLDKMANMPVTASLLKRRYCQGDNSTCARYMVFKALGKAPADLFPNKPEEAKEIISKGNV